MVHVRDMEDDFYEYDERSYSLIGYHSRKKYRLGDVVTVILAAARPESREIDLVFPDAPNRKKKTQKSPAIRRGALSDDRANPYLGAGNGIRTRVFSLEGRDNSHYTIPAYYDLSGCRESNSPYHSIGRPVG